MSNHKDLSILAVIFFLTLIFFNVFTHTILIYLAWLLIGVSIDYLPEQSLLSSLGLAIAYVVFSGKLYIGYTEPDLDSQ